jgi:sarcosine oxidase subunit beta
VNAAGPWAGEVGRTCGLVVPVVPQKRQVAATVLTNALPPRMPMTIFADDGFHFRVRDGRVLLLAPADSARDDPFGTSIDDEFVEQVTARARAAVPVLRDVPIDRPACWAGLYELSPDRHAILGPHPACPNLFLINGSSGHGVMHSPALGHLLAEIITSGSASTLDVTALGPGRFAANAPNPDSGVL